MGFISGKVCPHLTYHSECGYCRMARNDEIMVRQDRRQAAYFTAWQQRQHAEQRHARQRRKAAKPNPVRQLANETVSAGVAALFAAMKQSPAEPRPVQVPPGWYRSPRDQRFLQWWDGTAWSEHYHLPTGWYQGADGAQQYWDGQAWSQG